MFAASLEAFKPRTWEIHNLLCRSFHVSWSALETHYETLNVPRNCSAKDIRDSYIRLSKEYHPDRNRNDPQNHMKFVKLNEAYNILSKPQDRAFYDRAINVNIGRSHDPQNYRTYTSSGTYTAYEDSNNWEYRKYKSNYDWSEYEREKYNVRTPRRQTGLSNGTVALLCIVWIAFGTCIQLFSLRHSVLNREKMYEDSHRIGVLHADIRRRAQQHVNDPYHMFRSSSTHPHDPVPDDNKHSKQSSPELEYDVD